MSFVKNDICALQLYAYLVKPLYIEAPRTPACPWLLGSRGSIRQTEKLAQGRGKGKGWRAAILPSVGHLELITTFKIAADCCQLCQIIKPNLTSPILTQRNSILY